jgi:hypothetical protein
MVIPSIEMQMREGDRTSTWEMLGRKKTMGREEGGQELGMMMMMMHVVWGGVV